MSRTGYENMKDLYVNEEGALDEIGITDLTRVVFFRRGFSSQVNRLSNRVDEIVVTSFDDNTVKGLYGLNVLAILVEDCCLEIRVLEELSRRVYSRFGHMGRIFLDDVVLISSK